MMKSNELLPLAVRALDSKKAQELSVLRIGDLTVLTDYFVLATATSSTHVHALADEVQYQLEQAGITPNHIEGRATGWVLLDYGSVIVHVFTKDARAFYALDAMWGDAQSIDVSGLLGETDTKGE